MLLFAHTGITLGIAIGVAQVLSKTNSGKNVLAVSPEASTRETVKPTSRVKRNLPPWLDYARRYIDLRVLIVGSMLPDIIDKPLGHYFLMDTFSNGRIYSHTLVFLLVSIISGLIIFRKFGQTWMLVLAFGTFVHLGLDFMWTEPSTLLWPAYGFTFPRADIGNWISDMWHSLLSNPIVALPEIIGAVVIGWFGLILLRAKAIWAFLRNKYS